MLKNIKINLKPSECYEVISFSSNLLKICGLFPIKVIKNEFNQHQISLSKIGLIFTALHLFLYMLFLIEFLFKFQAITFSRSRGILIIIMECLTLTIICSSIYQVFKGHKKFVTKLERLEVIFNELKIDVKPALRRIKIFFLFMIILLVFYLIIEFFLYFLKINGIIDLKAILTQIYIFAEVIYFVVVVKVVQMGLDACNQVLVKM